MSTAALRPAPHSVVNRFFEWSLLGMLTAGYFAVAGSGYLDWPTAVLALLGLCLRGLMIAEVISIQVPPRVVAALAVAYLGFFPLDFYYLSRGFLAATVHMVFFLSVLKLLTVRRARDYGYLKVIAGLELVAAAVLSAGLSFLAYMVVFLLFAIATFASGEVRRAAGTDRTGTTAVVSRGGMRAFSRRLSVLSACLFAGILVMTAGLFLVLPRTARAALERFVPQQYRLTGFSNSVTLGEIGEIKQSMQPVMHVRSYQREGFLPVRWRGAALAMFDGKRWFNPEGQDQFLRVQNGVVAVRTAVAGMQRGRNLIYQVHLEPLVAETLFFAGTVETISADVPFLRYTRGGSFHVPARFAGRGLNYGAYGFLPDEWAEVRFTAFPLAEPARHELLSLPPLDPRIPELAMRMTAGAQSEVEKSRSIERHLRSDYGYTLQLLTEPVKDPLAYFLFERKKGHCEYFASAMAVLLRTQGIPARVVTGFQSGTYNPMTGWQVVRASDAHSWVEAWLEGRGWTTFDPTPPDSNANSGGLLSQMALLSDTASQFWQDWVMSYDVGHQVALASRLQASGRKLHFPDFKEFLSGLQQAVASGWRVVVWVVALLALAVVWMMLGPRVVVWWHKRTRMRKVARGQGDPSDATVLYQQMLELLAQRGIQKPPWLTPLEFACVVRPPEVSRLVEEATGAYNELRFGGNSGAAPRMVQALDQMRELASQRSS